jgi:hypothetical protein
MKRPVTLATIIFVALAVVFAILAIIARYVFEGDAFAQGVLLATGAAVFGSGLTFFLIEIFSLLEKKSGEAEKVFELELRRG